MQYRSLKRSRYDLGARLQVVRQVIWVRVKQSEAIEFFKKEVGWFKEREMGHWLGGKVIEARKAFLKKEDLNMFLNLKGDRLHEEGKTKDEKGKE